MVQTGELMNPDNAYNFLMATVNSSIMNSAGLPAETAPFSYLSAKEKVELRHYFTSTLSTLKSDSEDTVINHALEIEIMRDHAQAVLSEDPEREIRRNDFGMVTYVADSEKGDGKTTQKHLLDYVRDYSEAILVAKDEMRPNIDFTLTEENLKKVKDLASKLWDYNTAINKMDLAKKEGPEVQFTSLIVLQAVLESTKTDPADTGDRAYYLAGKMRRYYEFGQKMLKKKHLNSLDKLRIARANYKLHELFPVFPKYVTSFVH
jgi:hypothetical protein